LDANTVRTIAAGELKKRGVGAFDDLLQEGPLYVIKNNRPQYVLLTVQDFEEFVEDQHEAETARIKASEGELRLARTTTAQELIDELKLRE
jgi:PHD/YefM family antitoxin component YafN of YafNO toxin-antitoxin module